MPMEYKRQMKMNNHEKLLTLQHVWVISLHVPQDKDRVLLKAI